MENALVDPSKIDWKSYFAARATGEVFSTKFYTYETSTNPAGVKMNASAGLRAVPSTETVKDADDFSCFGRVLPLNDKTGWFEYENLGELKQKVSYVVGLHGGKKH